MGARGAIRDAEVEKGQALEAQAQEHRELIEHLKSEHEAALQEAMSNLEAQKAAFTEQASDHSRTVAALQHQHKEEIQKLKEELEMQLKAAPATMVEQASTGSDSPASTATERPLQCSRPSTTGGRNPE